MKVRILFIFGLAVGWLVVEVFASLVGPTLPEALVWHGAPAQKKIAILESDIEARQLVTGTSQVMQGVDPRMFDDATINVALGGGVPELQEMWLLDEVLPRREVDRVIWGVNPLLDFAVTDTPPTVVVQYRDAPVVARPLLWRLERSLSNLSGIARSRRQFSGSGWFGSLGGEPGDIDDLGMRTNFEQQVTGQQQRLWAGRMQSFEYGKREHVVAVIAELRRRDIEVVLVEMPLPDRTIALLPGHSDRYAREQQRLEALANELQVELLHPPVAFQADHRFVDFTHFSASASAEFSNWLASELGQFAAS